VIHASPFLFIKKLKGGHCDTGPPLEFF